MKTFFTIAFSVLLGLNIMAQCAPNPAYQNESFGFWPSPIDGLPDGIVNTDYLSPITVKAPSNAGEIDPTYSAFDIDSIVLNTVDGLPDGYTYGCEDPDCFIGGGDLSCLYFVGNTSNAGNYSIVLNFTIYASNPVLGPQTVPYAYEGYEINVMYPAGINDLIADQITLSQNIPNPFEYQTMIPVNLKSAQLINFDIYNMIGEVVYSEVIDARVGKNEIVFQNDRLESGIYLYSITADGQTQTKRMAVKR